MTERMTLTQYRNEVRGSSVSPSGRVVAVDRPTSTKNVLVQTAKPVKVKRAQSPGETLFSQQLTLSGISAEREFRFHPKRMWRFDFAIPARRFAVEIEGGVFVNGRHSRGKAYEADCEKYAEALILGWLVLRVTTDQVKRGEAISWLQQALNVVEM